jgi:hydrogenase-4 membrane subunit HyfE
MQSKSLPQGEKIIGISVLLLTFVLLPLFLYYRFRNKNLKDYMLTKENIDKMIEKSKKSNL